MNLRDRVRDQLGELPNTIEEWVSWTLSWLDKDPQAREALFEDVADTIKDPVGKASGESLAEGDFGKLAPAISSWIKGETVQVIEQKLGGDPTKTGTQEVLCPRARDLISAIIPRGFSFTLGLVAKVVKDSELTAFQPGLDLQMIEFLSAAVRKGYDFSGQIELRVGAPIDLKSRADTSVFRISRMTRAQYGGHGPFLEARLKTSKASRTS